MNATATKFRLHEIDAIRGFAIVSIMLLHNLEHFDIYFLPPNFPDWLVKLDKIVWDTTFFLFAGKSYAMFALLFGLTFFIQSNNQEKKGKDFRARFAWRLLLLFGFGILNSAFYQGDILSIYAVLGFFLIPVAKLSDKVVFGIAVVLFLQPSEFINLYHAIQHPDMKISDPESWYYFGKMDDYIKDNSFINTVIGNLTNGKMAVLKWSWENGRFFHILSLFLFGMLAGRKKIFIWSEQSKIFWKKALVISSILFIPLFFIQKNIENWVASEAIKRSLTAIETSWANIAFMVILIAGFMLLFQREKWHKVLNLFSPIGRMSLSNYIIQSIIGATLYYGFGFGLYQYTGATFSFLIGIVLAILLGIFCSWWMKNHKHGPFERIWHKATWIGSENN
jgi:uncharacterized protein